VRIYACVAKSSFPVIPPTDGIVTTEAAASAAAVTSLKARLCSLAKIGLFNVVLNVPRRTVS
jgi:hypothetical protein